MTEEKEKKATVVRFPKALHKDLKRLAVEKETSMTKIIVEAVKKEIKAEGKKDVE